MSTKRIHDRDHWASPHPTRAARRPAAARAGAFLAGLVLGLAGSAFAAAPAGFSERAADVNGTRLGYWIGGKGDAVVLLHGFAQTGHMWQPLMSKLASRHTVVVPDLRGTGRSAKPDSGYDKKTMAVDVHELVRSLGLGRASVVGHDIGLMVAYAYAAQFPQETERVVLMDAFLPGIGPWQNVWLLRDLWHFHFYGTTPLALVTGRERIYLEHFWNDFAADKQRSVSEADRQLYAAAFAQPGAVAAGFEYFRNFERDAKDFAAMAATPLTMPLLVLTGEKASGTFLIDQARLVATNVKGIVVPGSGHWLMDEAPDRVIPELVAFLDEAPGAQQPSAQRRLDPKEISSLTSTGGGAGTSGLAGIRTRVLKGDPTQPGLYSIQLEVPANTRIEAHVHPDDRIATVVSGTWYFGYGAAFDERRLKALPHGSAYSEPPNDPHFARTGSEAVVLQIVGVGPTGTTYADRGTAPATSAR